MTMTDDRMKAFVELGFAGGGGGKSKSGFKTSSFEERVEELKSFKKKHGHARVTLKHDNSLAKFCTHMRAARRGKGTMTITHDIIKALDELGFEWTPGT